MPVCVWAMLWLSLDCSGVLLPLTFGLYPTPEADAGYVHSSTSVLQVSTVSTPQLYDTTFITKAFKLSDIYSCHSLARLWLILEDYTVTKSQNRI